MDATLEHQLDRITCLAGQQRSTTALTGGLTNQILRVTTTEHDLVVRISSPSTGLLSIDRDVEEHNARAAATAGVGPSVVERIAEAGVLVVEFIRDAVTFDDAAVGANLARIGATVRQLHDGPAFAGRFDMFDIQRRYLAIMRAHAWPLPEGYEDLLGYANSMEAALRRAPEPLVPCHNDLLAANFLDDGQRIWILDYEYSGMNEPAFELGNIIQEAHLGAEQLTELVTAYSGRPDPVREARARLWGIESAYAWTLWGMIQLGLAEIDYDFHGWAMDKYDRAREAFADPGFDDLVDAVGRAPTNAAGQSPEDAVGEGR